MATAVTVTAPARKIPVTAIATAVVHAVATEGASPGKSAGVLAIAVPIVETACAIVVKRAVPALLTVVIAGVVGTHPCSGILLPSPHRKNIWDAI